MLFHKKEKTISEIIAKTGYDPFLLARIQPGGGLSYNDERFVKMGDGYVACLNVYKYKKNINAHWLGQLTNISNSIVTIDISTQNPEEVRRNINKSSQEQRARLRTATEQTELDEARARYEELKLLSQEISQMGEVVKEIHTRIFLYHRTTAGLENIIAKTIKYLESNDYKASVYLNEQGADWKAFYRSATYQSKTAYHRMGQPVPATSLAGGNPFHFTALNDPCGAYFGTTLTSQGSVLLDIFNKTDKRTHYSGLLTGTLGSGKSTALKKIVEDVAIRGNFVRGFDVSGEFARLCESLGGSNISLDGKDGILNQLEIISVGNSETGDSATAAFTTHMSKLKIIYKYLAPYADQYEAIEFEEVMNGLYKEWNLVPAPGVQITGLPAKSYPIWGDALNYIDKLLREAQAPKDDIQRALLNTKMQRLNNIRLVISNLVNSYGQVVNGHTSIDNIATKQVVFFDISNLKSMKSEIFDMQVFGALYFCWANAVQIGQKMLFDYNDGKIAFEDVVRTLIVIDEAHHIVNANKVTAVEQLLKMDREARKYFAALWFASQSVRDFFPENASQEGIDQIRTLFELMQYRILLKQDNPEVIQRVFGNSLTQSQINSIVKLEQGQCILSIAGDSNIQFHIDISKEEEKLFAGGA